MIAAVGVVVLIGGLSAPAVEDTEPPLLLGVSIKPKVVKAGGQITVTLQATDNLSGVCVSNCQVNGVGISPTQIRFISPSGNQFLDVLFIARSGDTYTGIATIGAFAEAGPWRTAYILLVDNAGNSQQSQGDGRVAFKVLNNNR
jgi:hypothetical protein